METLKILVISSPGIVTPPPDYGGLEAVAANHAEELRKRGHEVTIVASYDSPKEWYKERDIQFIPTVYSTITGIPEIQMWQVALAKIKDFNKFNIIQDHSHTSVSILGQIEAMKQNKPFPPCARTLHDDCPHTTPPPIRHPCFISPSFYHSSRLSAQFGYYSPISRVVWHGIPIEKYPYQEEKGDRYLTIGRIQYLKGIHMAIELCRQANVPLDVVGDDSHLPNHPYVDAVKSLCDGKLIKYYGKVDHITKVKFLQNAKGVILLSSFYEPYGLIAPEANATGTPCIVNNMGGLSETTKHGKTGFRCEYPSNVLEALESNAIESIKPKDCRVWVESLFTVEHMVSRYLRCYRDLLDGKRW